MDANNEKRINDTFIHTSNVMDKQAVQGAFERWRQAFQRIRSLELAWLNSKSCDRTVDLEADIEEAESIADAAHDVYRQLCTIANADMRQKVRRLIPRV